MDDEKRRIAALRLQLLANHPFWGCLLLESQLIPSPGLPTLAATDGVRRIWYNPDLTRYLTTDELGFVLAHEVGHVVLESAARRRGRDPVQWNCASDYAVNRIVAAIHRPGTGTPMYTPPRKFLRGVGRIAPLMDDRFDGMTAEAIYEALGENPVWDRPQGEVQLEILPDGRLQVAGPPDPTGRGGRVFRVDQGIDVWDLHVPPEADFPEAPGMGGWGGDPDEALRSELWGRISRAVEQAERAAQPGSVPGEVRREIHARKNPSGGEPWQEVFRRIVAGALARDEYTWARPHRRWLEQGFLVPGLRSDALPSVAIAVDTSASMSRHDLAQVCGEIRPVLARSGDAVLIVHDAGIQEVVRGTAAILRWIEEGWTRGGGGTDHRPVFDWIAGAGLDPDLFVGLTDCESVYPDAAPGYPVVWVTPLHAWKSKTPWGKRVWVDPV